MFERMLSEEMTRKGMINLIKSEFGCDLIGGNGMKGRESPFLGPSQLGVKEGITYISLPFPRLTY